MLEAAGPFITGRIDVRAISGRTHDSALPRRAALAGAVAGMVVGAAASGGDPPNDGTLESLARLEFEALGPEIEQITASPEDWQQGAADDYLIVWAAVNLLRGDHHRCQDMVAEIGFAEARGIIDPIFALKQRCLDLAEILQAAGLRGMVGLARAVSAGQLEA